MRIPSQAVRKANLMSVSDTAGALDGMQVLVMMCCISHIVVSLTYNLQPRVPCTACLQLLHPSNNLLAQNPPPSCLLCSINPIQQQVSQYMPVRKNDMLCSFIDQQQPNKAIQLRHKSKTLL